MEENLRNGLIIVSAIVIAAIFIHGYWTIRKNKNPYKLKTKKGIVEPENRGFDGKGFDQDGVGKARVVSESLLEDSEIPKAPAPAPGFDEEPLPKDVVEDINQEITLEPQIGDLEDISEQAPIDDIPPMVQSSDNVPEQVTIDDFELEEPVISISSKPETKKRNKPKTKVEREQIELNFGDETNTAVKEKPTKQKEIELPEVEPEVIVVSVVMHEGQSMSGAALLPLLLTLGLRYGEMDIFHRHEDNAGNGKVTFSLANMMNPGTFALDDIETFSTQGISLFMTLPNAGDPFEVFDNMMTAAKQLAVEFGGQLLDDKRSVMTKQTEQHYIGKIREFERKNRIASF